MAIDFSVLAGYTGSTSMMLTASKASRAAAAREASGTAAATPDLKTPWDTSNSTSDTARLVAALQSKTLINERDSSFDQTGMTADYKKLFTLYKGLATLQTLANAGADKNAQPGSLIGLDRRFQTGFAEIMNYASGLELDTLMLLTGPKLSAAQSSAKVTRASSTFNTHNLVSGDAQQPLAGLENASPFTITVKRGTQTMNVAIDLAEMTGTRNLGNVVNFINGKLGEAGVLTRLQRIETTPAAVDGKATPVKSYALSIVNPGSETVSFNASSTSTALYMANQGIAGGELRKLNVDGATPVTVNRAAIADASGDINVKQTVTDANGNVFVLGTTNADQGAQVNQSSSDVMLRKYDSAGNLIWSKLMGATSAADGLGLAVDSKGAAVVAGQITGKLGTAAAMGGKDSFVLKIDANGEEVFARQLGSVLDDGATAITVGPDDAIYVGGQVKGRMTGAAATVGGNDAYVMKFDSKGTRVYTRQFGSTGDDRLSSMAIDDSGDLVVATIEGGQGVLRKFGTANATDAAVWTQGLGDLATGGAIAQIVAKGGKVYVAGSTANASLTGGAGVVTAHSGGQDGFVYQLDDGGTSTTAGFMTFLGSGSADKINGLAVSNGRIFVAGETRGTLPGATQTRAGVSNAFAAELSATGALDWASQFGVTTGEGYGRGLAVDASGASALDVLGLPKGQVSAQQARTITSQTTARAGDYFTVQVGDLTARRITIAAGETMTTLARKVNAVLGLNGKASVVNTSTGQSLKIEPREGESVTLKGGDGHLDALKGLGLSAGRFVKATTDGEAAASDDELPVYALGLKASYSLRTTAEAAAARGAVESALSVIRTAYRELTMDPELKKMLAEKETPKGKQGGVVPAYLQSQLANYNAGLQRLMAGSSTQTVT